MSAYMQLDSGTVIETANPENWHEAKRLPTAKGRALLKAEAKAQLLDILKPGDTVHTVLRHVSRSGMRRRIDLYQLRGDEAIYLSGYAARVLDSPLSKDGGIVTDGCGMDMGFHLVYNLSISLFCEPGKYSHDKAYALKHRWL